MNTFMANEQSVTRKWYIVDATDVPLGRLASQVAAPARNLDRGAQGCGKRAEGVYSADSYP